MDKNLTLSLGKIENTILDGSCETMFHDVIVLPLPFLSFKTGMSLFRQMVTSIFGMMFSRETTGITKIKKELWMDSQLCFYP